MVLNCVGVVNLFDKYAREFNFFKLSVLTWGEFKLFIKCILVSHQVFIKAVEVDVVFDPVNEESNSSKSFVKVVVVSDVADGVQDPSEEDLEFIEIVDFFGGLLDFFEVNFSAFFLAES